MDELLASLREAILTQDSLKRVVTLLKATFTHLVMDVSKAYNEIDVAAAPNLNTFQGRTNVELMLKDIVWE